MLGSNVEIETPAMYSHEAAERLVNGAWPGIQEYRAATGQQPETEEFRSALIHVFSSPRKPLSPQCQEIFDMMRAEYMADRAAA